jgi:hypothetical protein
MKSFYNLRFKLFLVILLFCWIGGTFATSASSVVDLSPARDTYINEWEPNTNYGSGHDLRVRWDLWQRSLLHFNTTSIPTNSTVQSARLYLYRDWYDNLPDLPTATSVRVYRVNSDWTEMGATWNLRMAGSPWTAGGCNSSVDRSLTAAATTNVLETSRWYSWDITALVQDWISNPAGNHGMILISSPDTKRELRFHSKEAATNKPYLRIQYTAGTGPGPTATPVNTPVPGTTPTATPGIPPVEQLSEFRVTQDTYIDEYAPNTNYNLLGLRVMGQGIKKSLLDFDVSSIPQGSQILSADLSMTTSTLYNPDRPWPIEVGVYKVNRSWLATQATWNTARTGQPWAMAGCNSVPTDRDSTPASTTWINEVSTGTAPSQRKIYTWDATSIVQSWVNNPAGRAGMVLQSNTAVFREVGFWDSAYQGGAGVELHPLLTVRWMPPAPAATATPTATPTQTSIAAPTQTPTSTATAVPEGATITGIVYRDVNHNGARDAGETGLVGFKVQLSQGTNLVQEQLTNSEGRYTLHGVQPGNYTLRVVVPQGYTATTPNPRPLTVVNNQQTLTFDFGMAPPAMSSAVYLPVILR